MQDSPRNRILSTTPLHKKCKPFPSVFCIWFAVFFRNCRWFRNSARPLFCANFAQIPTTYCLKSLFTSTQLEKIFVFAGNTVLMLAASSTSRNALMIVECGCLEFQRIWSASAGTVTGDCVFLGRSQNRRTFEETWQ